MLIWQARWNRLKTNSMLYRRRVRDSPLCGICGMQEETVLHALRDCSWVSSTWKEFLLPGFHRNFFQAGNTSDWVDENLSAHWNIRTAGVSIPWEMLFREAVNCFWRWRNMCYHEPHFEIPPPHVRTRFVIDRVLEVLAAKDVSSKTLVLQM
jgi:hypothetical protein